MSSRSRLGSARVVARAGSVALAVLALSACTTHANKSSSPSTSSSLASPKVSPSTQPPPSPPPPTLMAAIKRDAPLVTRIETTTCSGVGVGSGFLVAPDLVATVAHVVDSARTISIRSGVDVSSAVVVGVDRGSDVALLRLRHPLAKSGLVFASQPPVVGAAVASLGYLLGKPLSSTTGSVSALDRRIDFERSAVAGLVEFAAVNNRGNSGGPVINTVGEVIGLSESGYRGSQDLSYAVAAKTALPLITAWKSNPSVRAAAPHCPVTDNLVTIKSRHAEAPSIAFFLHRYFGGINAGSKTYGVDASKRPLSGYQLAYSVLSGRVRGQYRSFADFAAKQSTTKIRAVVVEQADMVAEVADTVDVSFTSVQAAKFGRAGQTCSLWHLRYTVRFDSGNWSIDTAQALGGSPKPCGPPP